MAGGQKRAQDEVTNSDLASMIANLTKKVDKSLADQRVNAKKFTAVEGRLDFVEKEVNRKALIVTGIKAADEENHCDIIVKVSRVIGCSIQDIDIDDIWRFGRAKERIKVIFLRSLVKRNLLKKIRERKRLSTKEIGLSYDTQIYINEDLGRGAQEIWREARELKKRKVIAKTWVAGGRVYYMKEANSSPLICKNPLELQLLDVPVPTPQLEEEELADSESDTESPEVKQPANKNRRK